MQSLTSEPVAWGWYYKSPSFSVFDVQYDIYAAAGQNDISKGWKVGIVKYTYSKENKSASAKFFVEYGVRI